MAYPDLAQLVGSQMRIVSDRKAVRDTGGAARIASFYDADKHEFTLRHRLTSAEVATLRSYFAAQRTSSFDLVWSLDGATYTVVFGPRGVQVSPGAATHDVEVELWEA